MNSFDHCNRIAYWQNLLGEESIHSISQRFYEIGSESKRWVCRAIDEVLLHFASNANKLRAEITHAEGVSLSAFRSW